MEGNGGWVAPGGDDVVVRETSVFYGGEKDALNDKTCFTRGDRGLGREPRYWVCKYMYVLVGQI
jgi:hypothetical protein